MKWLATPDFKLGDSVLESIIPFVLLMFVAYAVWFYKRDVMSEYTF